MNYRVHYRSYLAVGWLISCIFSGLKRYVCSSHIYPAGYLHDDGEILLRQEREAGERG